MITLENLGKDFGSVRAVDSLSVTVAPGKVTGFLGPNGAGKTTTMRMLLGLDAPSSGRALVNGVGYAQLAAPLRTVGALLEPRTGHRGQRAESHLRGLARSNRIPVARVDAVLQEVGLGEAGRRRIGTFSLGMRQRLGIAAALLGEPEVLVFDEPVNGLDADGVAWIRDLMRAKARAGATVFVSSHLMSEMQSTADHLVVIGRGKLLADESMDAVLAASAQTAVVVSSPQAGVLAAGLERAGYAVAVAGPDSLRVTGATTEEVGGVAHSLGVRINELGLRRASLEQAYTELTARSLDYVPTRIGEES
ncbi:ATP-binding cassette domain-containing protein [Paeniglutamicibacter psychrophenolicus]|uniref:ATP-binding cassette domain-containing protein n=1 Tax=Paeniglutamicibacter psychrophenolicus TaxID=257454 RepID=UPI00278B2DEB|nr:ATP-binding cassette domain-containing protein [Paeniglutamicibacter psychrophenolicus]MDQ0096216.1 ABC-2 type transport system ATP-binding protein [Paeniglutamicibacter psychrophenolicus]